MSNINVEIITVDGTGWEMTVGQASFLLQGGTSKRTGRKFDSLLSQLGMDLPAAWAKYGIEMGLKGQAAIDRMVKDLQDARDASSKANQTGERVRDQHYSFAVALFVAAETAGGILARKVVPILEDVIDRAIDGDILEARVRAGILPEGTVVADRYQVSQAIEHALIWFDQTHTPRPRRVDSDGNTVSNETGDMPELDTVDEVAGTVSLG